MRKESLIMFTWIRTVKMRTKKTVGQRHRWAPIRTHRTILGSIHPLRTIASTIKAAAPPWLIVTVPRASSWRLSAQCGWKAPWAARGATRVQICSQAAAGTSSVRPSAGEVAQPQWTAAMTTIPRIQAATNSSVPVVNYPRQMRGIKSVNCPTTPWPSPKSTKKWRYPQFLTSMNNEEASWRATKTWTLTDLAMTTTC